MNAPKISKANIAYITSVIALCFSTSIWSLNKLYVQGLFYFAVIIFGLIVAKNSEKKTTHKSSTQH